MLLNKIKLVVGCISLVFMTMGCASVPQASVDLSEELTRMIIHSRQAHLNLLNQYTNNRKAEVEKFMTEKYIPTFTANFVRESGILSNIQRAETNKERGAEILEFSEAAFPIINQRRTLLMEAIDQIDRLIRKKIGAHYQEMLNINQALTANLASAAEVVQTRQQLQKQLKVDMAEILPLDRANEIMKKMLDLSVRAEEVPQIINEFRENVKR